MSKKRDYVGEWERYQAEKRDEIERQMLLSDELRREYIGIAESILEANNESARLERERLEREAKR